MRHEALEEALELRKKVRADLLEHFQGENLPCEPAVLRCISGRAGLQPDGKPAKTPGFDGIIGNPPWEGFKPIRKEFAANFYRGKPQFSKMGMDGPTFEKWFADELKENQEFAARWREHEALLRTAQRILWQDVTRSRAPATGICSSSLLSVTFRSSGRAGNSRCSCRAASRRMKVAPICAAGSSPNTGWTN